MPHATSEGEQLKSSCASDTEVINCDLMHETREAKNNDQSLHPEEVYLQTVQS